MKKILVFLIFPLVCSAFEENEDRLYRIYKNYNEKPIEQEQWLKIIGEKKEQNYTIQKGDTLWDLSETLFGDGFYWPKVWSVNDNITNPHLIEPGLVIRFFSGSLDTPPAIMVDGGEKPLELLKKQTLTQKPVGEIPDSLPDWKMAIEMKQTEVGKLVRKENPRKVTLDYFALDSDVESVGIIKSTELDLKTAGQYQYIYVEIPNELSQKRLLAIEDHIKIKNGESVATIVKVLGEIEVLDVVNKEENLYRAVVHSTIDLVSVGAKLIPGEISYVDGSTTGEVQSLPAQIIGGQFAGDRIMAAREGLVYLNAGKVQGAQIGSELDVFSIHKIRVSKSKEVENFRRIGKLKIVHTSENYSTAVVVDAQSEIRTGDVTTRQ